jgi:MFS family permease
VSGGSGGLIPDLPKRAWEVLAFDAVSSFGSGLVLPFLIIYLHRVRGIEIEIAGLALGMVAVTGLVAGPVAGSFVDRFGARIALMVALAMSATGALLVIWVREPWQAFVATAVIGAGEAAFWPSIQSLLAGAVSPEHRSSVFAVHYATQNAGLGVGGVLGGLIANISSPSSFELLYLFDAFTFAPFFVLLLRSRALGAKVESDPEETLKIGYLSVLRDRVFLRVFALMALLAAIGYAQVESGFPAFAVDVGKVGTRGVGIAFATNTFMVVSAQFVTLKMMRGKRRTRALMVLAAMWATCWGLVFGSSFLTPLEATIGFSAALGCFAIGETLLSPTIAAIVNDLAPENLRGRYNAVYTLAWSVGAVIGPPVATFFLGAGLGRQLFLTLIVTCGAAALYALRLERHLPASVNLPAAPDVA